MLVVGYEELDKLLSESEATREALHQMVKQRQADGLALRGVPS